MNKDSLDQVRVASPCNARWEDMTGDEQARFCGHCRKHVYNLSAMIRQEVETLVREKEGRFCGRIHRRRDGTVLTADCPSGRRVRRNRIAGWLGAVCGTFMMLILGRTTLRAEDAKPETEGSTISTNRPSEFELLGDMAIHPPVMGIVAPPSTNTPPATNGPTIMGRIRVIPATNAPSSAPE